jgi:hypothetical protein
VGDGVGVGVGDGVGAGVGALLPHPVEMLVTPKIVNSREKLMSAVRGDLR